MKYRVLRDIAPQLIAMKAEIAILATLVGIIGFIVRTPLRELGAQHIESLFKRACRDDTGSGRRRNGEAAGLCRTCRQRQGRVRAILQSE